MWVNHCHILPDDHTELSLSERGSITHWPEVAGALGIKKAVAFAPFPYQVKVDPNAWLASILPQYPSLIGCATIHPLRPDAPQLLRHYVQEHGFRAAKLHPPVMEFRVNDPAADAYYAAAEELGVPITFHTGVHGWRLGDYAPLLFDEVAQRHPHLKIMMAHTGGTAFFDQALAVLQNRPNIYAELAQTRRIVEGYCWHLSDERIKMLLETVGPHRVVYGCDWPWVPLEEIRRDVERIRGWGLSDADQSLILGGNLRRVLAPELAPKRETANVTSH